MRKIFFIGIAFIIGLLVFVSAVDFTPQGDINLRDVYNIKNVVSIDANNITADGYFIGDGSLLTGITATGATNDTWVDTYFVRFTELVSQIGNWTLDKLNYYNTTQTDTRYVNIDGDTWEGDMSAGNYNLTDIGRLVFNTTGCGEGDIEGTVCWNANDQVLEYVTGLSNVIQIGQEQWALAKNGDSIPLLNGQVVTLIGSSGDRGLVARADSSNSSLASRLSVVTIDSCAVSADCPVTTFGRVRGLNTSVWVSGTLLYLSADGSGNLTSIVPAFPNYRVAIAFVIRSHEQDGIIFVGPNIDYTDGVTINDLYIRNNLTVEDDLNVSGFIYEGNILLFDKYYLKSNPFGFYNLTDFDISNYYTSTQTDTEIGNANTSVVNWVNELFPRISELVGLLGNWSADMSNYYNIAQTNSQIDSANTSMKNYVDALDTATNTSLANYVDSQDVIYNDSATTYTDSKLITTFFNASTVQAIRGTTSGTISLIQAYNGGSYNVTEESGAVGIDFRVNFTSITEFNQIFIRYKTTIGESHETKLQIYNHDTSSWENYGTVGEVVDYSIFTFPVFSESKHISGGVVQVRIYSLSNGNIGHLHQFDWVTISEGPATPSSSETDPFSIHHTGDVALTGNWDVGAFNITAQWFSGLIDASNIVGESWIDWSDVTNGTMASITDVIGFSYYNSTDFVISDYYLNSNPFGFYNTSTLPPAGEEIDPLWTGNQSSYSTTAVIIGWGYYNSTDFSISDYFTKANILGFNYYNSTDFSIADYVLTSALDYYTDSDIDGTEGAFSGWDKDVSDDFDGVFSSLSSIPTGLSDGDDDTTYSNLSEFLDDLGTRGYTHLSNFTDDSTHTIDTDTNLTEADVDSYVSNNGYADLTTILGYSWYNSTDFVISDYFTKSDVLGFDYFNLTDFDIADYSTTSQANGLYAILGYGDNWNKTFADTLYAAIGISGTVTSIAAGNGLDFTTITGSGSIILGTPGSLTAGTSNAVTTTSHTHAVSGFLESILSDTTPQLGGYLDTNGQNIGSTTDEIENIYIGDTTRIYFGDGQDASIYFNGTNLIIAG